MQEATPEYEERRRSESCAAAYAAVQCRLGGDHDGYQKWMAALGQDPVAVGYGLHALSDAAYAATIRWAHTFAADPVRLWCSLAGVLMNEHHGVPPSGTGTTSTPPPEPHGGTTALAAEQAKVLELVHAAVTARVTNQHDQVVDTVTELTATEQLGTLAILTAVEVVRGLVNVLGGITGQPPAQVWSHWATAHAAARTEPGSPPARQRAQQ